MNLENRLLGGVESDNNEANVASSYSELISIQQSFPRDDLRLFETTSLLTTETLAPTPTPTIMQSQAQNQQQQQAQSSTTTPRSFKESLSRILFDNASSPPSQRLRLPFATTTSNAAASTRQHSAREQRSANKLTASGKHSSPSINETSKHKYLSMITTPIIATLASAKRKPSFGPKFKSSKVRLYTYVF